MNLISNATGSGEFTATFAGRGTIPANTPSGVLLTLTPPLGQRVRITHLSSIGQNRVSISFGSTSLLSGANINGPRPEGQSGSYSIGQFQPYGATNAPPNGNHPHITGKADEAFIISLAGGPSNQILYYGYEYGL